MTIEIVRPADLPEPFPFYGDETFSVLALAVAALAVGPSELRGVPVCSDTLLLLDALAQFGVPVRRDGTTVSIRGVGRGGLHKPDAPVQTGDSGLVLRVLAGLAAGQPFETVIEAQGQLLRRSLVRMIEPLAEMGVHVAATYKYTPPLHVFGKLPVAPVRFDFPLPNFYLKIPLLLAALSAEEESFIGEPSPSVSHLENLLTCAEAHEVEGRYRVDIFPQDIEPFGRDTIPFDAAVADVALIASVLRGRDVQFGNVLVNPTRASALGWLAAQGNAVTEHRTGSWNCEAADVGIAAAATLPAQITIGGSDTRRFRTALPMIAALCAGRPVELRVSDAIDIRQNTCDWIAALVDGLAGFGAVTEEHDDGFLLRGTTALHGAGVACYNDETIALAMLALGAAVGDATVLYDVPDTPRVRHCMAALGLPAEA